MGRKVRRTGNVFVQKLVHFFRFHMKVSIAMEALVGPGKTVELEVNMIVHKKFLFETNSSNVFRYRSRNIRDFWLG